MPKINFPVVGTFNRVKQRGINPEETFNLYLVNENDDKVPSALINTPGYKQVLTFSSGANGRAITTYQNIVYAIVGQNVYRLNSNLYPILIGQLETDTGVCFMDGNNGNQLIITDGAAGYIYNTVTNIFAKIVDPNFVTSPPAVTFLDGRFIVSQGKTNLWQLSALNDGTTWTDPGDIPLTQRLQTDWDTIQAVAVNHRIVYIFGQNVTECWNDVGNPDFPFARIDSMIYQSGLAAKGSLVQGSGALFWLARSSLGTTSVMVSTGGMPTQVSSTDVDQEIDNYLDVSDATAYLFRENGYMFYALNFTKANASWLYNITNQTWTKQRMKDKSRHKLEAVTSFNDKNYALAYDDGNLYELSQDYVKNDTESIVKERITHRFLEPAFRDIRIEYIEIDCLHGFAAKDGIDATPFIEMAFSKDAGNTFSKTERAPIGRIGQRAKKSYWHNLGINRDWVFRFRCYNDIDFYLRDMSIRFNVVGP